jgi:hypothetical protein
MPDRPNTLTRSAIGRPLGVFRHRPFLIFWIGACISNTGNWVCSSRSCSLRTSAPCSCSLCSPA